MELEEIKRILETSEIKYSKREINDIFGIRTRRSLKSVNRKMLWDVLGMITMVLILVTITFMIGLQDRYLISAEIIGLAVILTIHYRIKYHLLNKFNYDRGVKTILITVKGRLTHYLKAYLLIIPTVAAALYLNTQWSILQLTKHSVIETAIRLGLTLPIVIFVYLVTKKLIMLVYGNNLNELEELIEEMDIE